MSTPQSNRSRRPLQGSRSFDESNGLGYGPTSSSAAASPAPGEEARPKRRMNRRASTGGYSGASSFNESGDKTAGDSIAGSHLPIGKSLTKQQSQEKLRQQLAKVNDYKDRDDKIQSLKERFSQGNNLKTVEPRRRALRRSSISSVCSQASMDPLSRSGDGLISSDISIDLSRNSLNQSANTLPMANRDSSSVIESSAKTDQVVESLVWFSFHTPRTVMEDLISHELDVWRKEERRAAKRNKALKASNQRGNYKMAYRSFSEEDDDSDEEDGGDDSSLSSLSDGEEPFEGGFSETMLRLRGKAVGNRMMKMPKSVKRESALLFVDMSGFTKLSTLLDVESLSKVINSYFDMIVTEVILHGGDVLKFAGDAFFAEWRVIEDEDDDKGGGGSNPLADLNASLSSFNDISCDDDDIPKLSLCTLAAAKCAASIVKKFSDYQVTSVSSNTSEAMLNVHCGVGAGNLVGIHVGNHKEDQEDDVEPRREFLILGSPIDQVSKAADVAADGEVMASPEAMLSLAFCMDLSEEHRDSTEPVRIASRNEVFIDIASDQQSLEATASTALQPYESLRMHCRSLNNAALARLHLQMALYVHPVIRADELALSADIQAGKISQPTEALESRHRAEAELRSVFTIFIKAVMSPRITGLKEIDDELFQRLCDIMYVTTRELDRYSGHLRQFIVDDKGVVLIATFGLRGSTFPNMISNNGLPAIFAIHRCLKTELKVESRIGATFGKVYCGVVGGVRRHEFAVMGAPVNLAARLMASKENRGILVDEAVREQADARYSFNSLEPVKAKGYDKPVPINEPIENAAQNKKKKSSVPFVGRSMEKETIMNIASAILTNPIQAHSTMVFLMGESGMGKSALAKAVVDDIKYRSLESDDHQTVLAAKSSSTETEQRIPLSSYRKVFSTIVRYFCEHDGTLSQCGDQATVTSASTTGQSLQSAPKTPRIGGRLKASTQHSTASSDTSGISSTEHQQRLSGISDHLLKSPHPGQNDNDGQLTMSPTRQMLRRAEGGKKFLPQSISASIHGTSMHEKPVLSQSAHPSLSKTPVPTSKESLSQSLHRIASSAHQPGRPHVSPVMKSPSRKFSRRSKFASNDEVSTTSFDATSVHSRGNGQAVPYFEKLCWVCEELDYPYEYADIVGSQFLGLDGASPVTHVDGHVPTMEELVEFLAFAFICLTDHADMTVVLLDDFQWVDAFSWRVFQLLCKKGKKLLVICATRSHDKQALRRLSNAASGQSQLQSRLIEISLGPLDYAEIRQLTARVLVQKEEAISDGLCTDIFQRTGGLPVYVVQTLENIKRKKSVELDENGMLQWTAEGLKEKRALMSNKTGVVMEETFLSRFDTLDARVRKVLQTCAVLGLSFALSDVVQVHPEIDEIDIENALEAAIDEMILVEQVEDEDDNMSLKSSSTGTGGDSFAADTMRSSEAGKTLTTDRFFQFSHAMWRQNVLTTMLKERKIELHRLIAESMEQDQVMILEQSDISRLLTLFEHWKSCGDFCKTSQLALAVGARLEEWDLCAQSLELYQDALEMSFDTVERVDQEGDSAEWIQVAAKPSILDYILRLHIRIGLCHQNLGEEMESIAMFEDAYNIIKSSSKIPGMSKALMMPIISSLCVLKLDRIANDNRTKLEQEKLAEKFVKEAINNGNPVHIGRAVAMEAQHYARTGDLERAFAGLERLASIYDIEANSFDMLAEYGRDFALECYCESVQWYYLSDQSDKAAQQADMVVKKYLPLLSSVEADIAMYAVLPLFQVYLLLGRVRDADALLKQYVINPYRDSGSLATFWAPLFNPLAYLVEVVIADEEEQEMSPLLMEIEAWVLNEENDDFYEEDLERYAHTVMGEICWRLMNFKEDDDPSREALSKKARDFLTPIACYPHVDSFLKQTAKALLEAL